jgi:hypothetical protein
MALTFPRGMPTVGVLNLQLEPLRADFLAPEVGGAVGAVAGALPLWRLDLQLAEMDQAEARQWRAFARSLRGPTRTFYARDLTMDYPQAYPAGFGGMTRAGGGAFPADGAPTSWSVNTDRDVLTLNGLPAGFQLTSDDLVGFVWTTSTEPRRTLAAAVEDVTASGGGVAAVTIDPPLPTLVPGGATITLYRPTCIMRLMGQVGTGDASAAGAQVGPKDSVSTAGGRVVAIQDLRP